MGRRDYEDDPEAPAPNSLVPAASVVELSGAVEGEVVARPAGRADPDGLRRRLARYWEIEGLGEPPVDLVAAARIAREWEDRPRGSWWPREWLRGGGG
ncbi:hypothetical protein ACWGB8_16870 [Kitasatospora sp. NPDC054939]